PGRRGGGGARAPPTPRAGGRGAGRVRAGGGSARPRRWGASHIDSAPPLPAACGHLLRRWTAGAIMRVNTVYETPFWRADGLNGETVAPQSPIPVSLDQSPRSGIPGILCSFSFGPPALALARLDPDQRRGR